MALKNNLWNCCCRIKCQSKIWVASVRRVKIGMLSVENGDWDQLQQDARLIRELVFIVEQNIPEQDEWDDQDAISKHYL